MFKNIKEDKHTINVSSENVNKKCIKLSMNDKRKKKKEMENNILLFYSKKNPRTLTITLQLKF